MPYKDRNKQLEFQRRYQTAKRTRRRTQFLQGKVCVRCGFSDARALEFHHKDGDTKLASVGQMYTYSEEKIKQEIAKCDVICANCHTIEHHGGFVQREDDSLAPSR